MFRTDLFREASADALMASAYVGTPLIVDSFAGGGGASTGIEMALGRSPDIAINHNPDALALHAANHPGPLVATERGLMPDPDRRGENFEKWCKKLRRLGGKIEFRELRACDYGAPTIRKRLFVIIRFDGKPIVWPEPTHGKPGDPDVISGRKLPWRTAAECIDWSLPCPSIFDTSAEIWAKHQLRAVRPLADATMARVARGMKRYVLDAERPFLVSVAHGDSGGRREYPIDEPHGVVTAGGISHAVVAPSVIRFNTGATGQDMRDPLSTVTANSFIKRPGGAAPLGIIAPVLTAAQQGGSVRSVADPHHTITASSKDQNSVIVPTLVGCGGRAGQSRPRAGDEPVGTITAKADGCVAVAFLAQNNYLEPGHDACEPLSTIVGRGSTQSPIVAFMAQHNGDPRPDGSETARPGRAADEPLATITQSGSQQSLVSAFVARQFGTSTGHAVDDPAATVMADGGGKSQLVMPYLQAYYGTGDGQHETEPMRTVTTKDRHGHVEATISVPPFTDAQADRARQVASFMRAHGFWDDREFVTVEISGETFVIVDIGMRMLTPRELFNAQGFPSDYVIDGAWNYQADGAGPVWREFSKSVQVSCVGNSVSPPVACALVSSNCSHLAEFREAAE